ncbi:hypothetical protein E1B28_008616 [Marasmius oreades]|uniref:PIN domain-containing protein n=1 Tax=Marasmius oreades TaxID=181124 RepID=A0A9P7UTG5_9AGAR|nr:uncharacterized protein E1B28_008616 [Marasmius oreades]KAG7092251.1 hypothetical protein E1B28_008616 [Marasmius oreades]
MPKGAPQPTDIDEKLIALRRRTAVQTRPKEKSERPSGEKPSRPPSVPTQQQRLSPKRPHQVIIQRPSDADAEDFSRLNISSHSSSRPVQSSTQSNPHSKLYNPDRDPIPTMRRTAEPESMSQTASNGRPTRDTEGSMKQLFDHRKDNPVRFSVLARPQQHGQRPVPTPKSSGEYISASSTSSYAASQVSSTFTLSSTTDGSSVPSALFDRQDKPHEESSGTNAFAQQLKRLYRTITILETKVQKEDVDVEKDSRDNNRILLKGKNVQLEEDEEEKEREKWTRQIEDHKRLIETIHSLLEISLAPSVPASLRIIPKKYNIIVRLWTFGFHKLLENLRRASLTSPLALEHLQDFIYFAYTFYTGLLDEPPLAQFRHGWLEALGDLARYRMMVAGMITAGNLSSAALKTSETAVNAVKKELADGQLVIPTDTGAKSVSNAPAARIDDSPSPSVGIAAARALEIEPEVERWRSLARDWYGKVLAEQPGAGRLHQHLGMLSRELPGEEIRAIYHFVKSMTTLRPFPLSRESILSIWSPEAQARRQLSDARLPDLFVLLHGMLFTNIQLDDFRSTLFRFVERLELEGAEERVWTMMAVINISSILEYNKPNGILKRCGGITSRESATVPVRVMTKKEAGKDDDKMDVDEDKPSDISPPPSDAETENMEQSMAYKLALELTFSVLSHVLRRPHRRASLYAKKRLNPYLTVILTFLATVLKHEKTLEVMEKSIPWEELTSFFATIPRSTMHSQGLMDPVVSRPDGGDRWMMLTSSCAPPLPEDWCLRGMEWVGRKVYERGYWKSGEDRQVEIEVLDDEEAEPTDDGRIEDGSEDENNSVTKKRYIRIARCAVTLADVVKGFTWVEGSREWRVEGELSDKIQQWKEEEQQEKEEEERRKVGNCWVDDSMDIDEDSSEGYLESSSDDDDELDTPEIRELKARRRHLQMLLRSSQMESSRSRVKRASRKEGKSHPVLPIQPGYTVLVVDTNILLSSLSTFVSLVESLRWTVLVPLPVVMELDGLKSNALPQLSQAADDALKYITSHIRSYSSSLKVQTSKGNYLTSLNVRTEEVDFASGKSERSMDDLILKTAIWHDKHWIDRSAMLKSDGIQTVANPIKVVLLSLDRNLRLKARSRQLPAAGETDLAMLLSDGT